MHWQPAPQDRRQAVLFADTLDSRIPADHQVRLLDEILASYDWSAWEAHYERRRGQPPIHPGVLARALLYGLMRRIRSSRQLEYAIGHNIDFMWLVEGRSLDHTTLAVFRSTYEEELKDLYRHVCRTAAGLGLVRLAEVAIDGTRVRADSNRYGTWNAEKLEQQLKQLDQQLSEALKRFGLEDTTDALLLEDTESFDRLPAELQDLQLRQAKLQELLKQVQNMNQARRREGMRVAENSAQIPITDVDSRVLPNKEGGYAPNYTPVIVADVTSGFILETEVLATAPEQSVQIALLKELQETFGAPPEVVLGDGVYSSGENLAAMEQLGIEQLSPLPVNAVDPANPALRSDPKQPVAAEDCDRLPIDPANKQLDKSAFIYVAEEDRYYCPQGRPLNYEQTKREERRGQRTERRVYRSPDCSDCPLFDVCVSKRSKQGRTVSRDVHEDRRQAHAAKMATEDAKQRYAARFHAAEAPFAYLKHVMGLRRFLLRGLSKVRTEWRWACTAYNLQRFISGLARLRALDPNLALVPRN